MKGMGIPILATLLLISLMIFGIVSGKVTISDNHGNPVAMFEEE